MYIYNIYINFVYNNIERKVCNAGFFPRLHNVLVTTCNLTSLFIKLNCSKAKVLTVGLSHEKRD